MPTIFVSNSATNGFPVGNDANDGSTPALAKLTIASAHTAAAAGDVIFINDGTYDLGASTLSLTKAVALEARTARGVVLIGTNATAIVTLTPPSSGALEIDALDIRGTGSSANVVAINNSANVSTVRLRGCALSGLTTTHVILDSYRIGTTELIDVTVSGQIPANVYRSSASLADVGAKTVLINGLHLSVQATATGATVAVGIERAAAVSNALTATVRNVTGRMFAPPALGVSAALVAIDLNKVANAVVDDIRLILDADGATANDSCIVRVRGTDSTAVAHNPRITRVCGALLAPAGYAIQVGAQTTASFTDDAYIAGCDLIGRFYASATPHGIAIGQCNRGLAINNVVRDFYVGAIPSINQGARFISNVFDGCYGEVLFSKGSGATTPPLFAANIIVMRRNPHQTGTGVFGVAIQVATNNAGALFMGNVIVVMESAAINKFVLSDASQVATFYGNLYALLPGASLPANAWEYSGTSYSTLAAWAAAVETVAMGYSDALVGAAGPGFPFAQLAKIFRGDLGVAPAVGALPS